MNTDKIKALAANKHFGTIMGALAVLVVFALEQMEIIVETDTMMRALVYGAAVLLTAGIGNHIDDAFLGDLDRSLDENDVHPPADG